MENLRHIDLLKCVEIYFFVKNTLAIYFSVKIFYEIQSQFFHIYFYTISL